MLRGHASETPNGPKDLPEHVRASRGAVTKRQPLVGPRGADGKTALQLAPSWFTVPRAVPDLGCAAGGDPSICMTDSVADRVARETAAASTGRKWKSVLSG